MNAIRSTYYQDTPLKKDIRSNLVLFGILLAMAGAVLVLQSFGYASSLPALWQSGQDIWGQSLGSMLQILAIWAFALGVLYAVQYVTQPVIKYGSEFWEAVITGFPLGMAVPFLLTFGAGLCIFIPLGLLSLLVPEVYPFATLQFTWLAGALLVFLWIVIGMPRLLADIFRQPRWYYKIIVLLLFLQLVLDTLQCLEEVLKILVNNSVWQMNGTALLLALFGSLFVSLVAALWLLRGHSALTIAFAITGVYVAAIVTGNFSERLFGWGELASAVLTLLSPLLYVQVAKWILRRDGTAVAGLAAGYIGLLAGLLVMDLLRLRISGQGWLSLVWGVIVVLGLGLALGYFLGRRVNRLLANRFQLLPVLLRYMDIGLVAGIMAGMFIEGFLAR